MNAFKKKTIASALGALALVGASIATATPALAAAESPSTLQSVPVTRVLNLTSQQVPMDHAALNTITKKLAATPSSARSASGATAAVEGSAVPLPAGVKLSAGETLQVNYSDGVVTHQAVTAACQVTSSVTKPYKSNNSGRADHTYGLGSGCSGATSVNAILSSYAAPLWHQRDFESTTVSPKTTMYWGTVKGCVNSGSTTWHAENAVGSSSISLSPNVNLACNPG